MARTPTKIERIEKNGIELHWDNGEVFHLTSEVLRKNCPSADSKMKRGDASHDKPLSGKSRLLNVIENTAEEELSLEKIWQIGNYAIGMRWADGHDSGIYSFDYLYELCQLSLNPRE